MHAVIEVTDLKFAHYWTELFANDPLQNPFYSQNTVEQVQRYKSSSPYIDRSFVVISENQPVFACSLTMHTDEQGRRCLGYFGLEASTHVNQSSMAPSSNNFKMEAVQLLQEHINSLIDEIQPNVLEYLDPVTCGVMSPVTQVLLEKGALPTVQTAKIIDLTLSEHALRHKIRKSQRGMIAWGQRNLQIDVVRGSALGESHARSLSRIFDEAVAAGESPYASLARYEELIQQNKAFLVRGRLADENEAAALFVHTARTCHYAFGSSKSPACDKPLMPALLWTALLTSKKIGCARFEMGRLAQSEPDNCERAKLLNSFGGDSQTRLKVCLAT